MRAIIADPKSYICKEYLEEIENSGLGTEKYIKKHATDIQKNPDLFFKHEKSLEAINSTRGGRRTRKQNHKK